MVTRIFRTAIKVGEDFITIEESVALPLDATPDDIQRAVDLGERIYSMQRAAVEKQVEIIRSQRPATNGNGAGYAEPPATDAQRRFIGSLQDKAGWTSEQLAAYAVELGFDMVSLTKGQASTLIEKLKDGRPVAPATRSAPHLPGFDDAPPPEQAPGDESDIPF